VPQAIGVERGEGTDGDIDDDAEPGCRGPFQLDFEDEELQGTASVDGSSKEDRDIEPYARWLHLIVSPYQHCHTFIRKKFPNLQIFKIALPRSAVERASWDVVISSLPGVEDGEKRELLAKLAKANITDEKPGQWYFSSRHCEATLTICAYLYGHKGTNVKELEVRKTFSRAQDICLNIFDTAYVSIDWSIEAFLPSLLQTLATLERPILNPATAFQCDRGPQQPLPLLDSP